MAPTPIRPACWPRSAPRSAAGGTGRRSWPTCSAPTSTPRGTSGSVAGWRRPAAWSLRPAPGRRCWRRRWPRAVPPSPRSRGEHVARAPPGGVVHTLHLAEALQALGQPVHVFALGEPGQGFYRALDVPHTIVPAPPWAPTLEERVWRNVDTLAEALMGAAAGFDLLHVQDCIAARAATRVREAGLPVRVVRTVHHVDDFTTPALVECQRRSIVDPDRVLVVSRYWRRLLRHEYGVEAEVVTNGVDAR